MTLTESTRPRRTIPTAAIKADIARLIEAERMGAGARLTEVKIASAAGLSRAPVRRAMEELAAEGVLEARETRGFSLRVGWDDPSWQGLRDATGPEETAYLRMAMTWHWISIGQYEHASRMVLEIGRLLGGWRKVTLAQPAAKT